MYRGELLSDGLWHSADTVVLTGSGHKGDDADLGPRVLPEADIESLISFVDEWRARYGLSPALIEHAIREARDSTLIGETPEQWSPLASATDAALYGRWRSVEQLAAGLAGSDGPEARFTIGDIQPDARAMIALNVAHGPVAAFGYERDGFVVPFSETTEAVEIRIEHGPEDERLWHMLESALPDGEQQTVILWRVYSGDNSWVRDAVSTARDGVHRLVLRGIESAGVVVGRAIQLVNRQLEKVKDDPFRQRRLRMAEARRQEPPVCPRIGEQAMPHAVVAVHGTMSSAVPLAAAIRTTVGGEYHCVRYEHDTWHPLEANATELAELIATHVRESVVLVGHSRGGLVAARAAQLLGASGGVRVAGLLTLGSPFSGTPVALAARAPSLGISALMGGLRAVGGPVVDFATRIGSLVLRLPPPRGIALMNTTNDALPLLRQYLPRPATTVAGTADGPADRYGASLIAGVGRGAFGDEPNDLVVAVASALVDGTEHIVVPCDHFSYGDEVPVRDAIRDLVTSRIPPGTDGGGRPPATDETLTW